MSTHTKQDDFCLECNWEAFHIDGEDPQDASEPSAQPQWACPDDEHHTLLMSCVVDEEACCDIDDCSVGCPSVCDGFVDCDTATACSVSHCDDTNCPGGEPVCFDEHCFTTNDQNNQPTDHDTLNSLLGLGSPLQLEACDLLPSTTIEHCPVQPLKPAEHLSHSLVDSTQPTNALFAPYLTAINHCHPHAYHHVHCHPSPRDSHDGLMNTPLPIQNGVNPADVFQMLVMCPSISECPDFHMHSNHSCEALAKVDDNNPANSFACLHLPHIPNDSSKLPVHSPVDVSSKGPCRSHHRCRIHPHAHIHPYGPYSHYSRHSRSSVSSQLISSPGETPPPLEGGLSSVLTSPESLVDNDVYVCKWINAAMLGDKTPCGATFSDPCALQEHLITSHMGMVDGAKGAGYYCCWEGCHRPDEPFSQKSKLQGHFLTHSNYKNFRCSVCGKLFARQATLERHERSHRGEKPYKCADCGKSFTDSSELKTHSRTHTGEKPFKCTYPGCNFQTGDSSNMSSHRLTHGERKHKCTYLGCSKSFTRPDQLKRHIRTTHKADSSAFPSPSPIIDQFAYPLGV